MQAMVLNKTAKALELTERPNLEPKQQQLLIKIKTCGVCRTDLHIFDGELLDPKLPLILGHQIVGTVEGYGSKVKNFKIGDRVGVPWLAKSCQRCEYCLNHQENLCNKALFTGYQVDGGYAEYTLADANYCFAIPQQYSDLEAAPLLCAGMIGYRAYSKTGLAKNIGFYGFGSSAHLLIQVAKHQQRNIFVFTRPGDHVSQSFALKLGATWVGGSDDAPPLLLDAAIIFAPVGDLVVQALRHIKKGGIVVCAGIHMSDIPQFPYSLLWGERVITSVANLTRQDGREFFEIAQSFKIKVSTTPYPLLKANEALQDMRQGKLTGSAVLVL